MQQEIDVFRAVVVLFFARVKAKDAVNVKAGPAGDGMVEVVPLEQPRRRHRFKKDVRFGVGLGMGINAKICQFVFSGKRCQNFSGLFQRAAGINGVVYHQHLPDGSFFERTVAVCRPAAVDEFVERAGRFV